MRKILFSMMLLASGMSQATISTPSPVTKVTGMSSYAQNYGDVIFKIETQMAGCEGGFWMSKGDPGYNANLAMMISAYHAKTPVVVYGLWDQIWSGSATKFCKLYVIELH